MPVWCAADDGTLLVFSEASSWKVKRIRRDPHVRVSPCNARNKLRGPALDGDASIVRRQAPPSAVTIRITPRQGEPAVLAGQELPEIQPV